MALFRSLDNSKLIQRLLMPQEEEEEEEEETPHIYNSEASSITSGARRAPKGAIGGLHM